MIEALYEQYFHDVYRYLRALTQNDSLAEELTQETFFRAMRTVDSFKGNCDVRVWLCQIAKNAYISLCRRQKHHTGEELPENVCDTAPPVQLALEESETVQEIHKILHAMKEPYKEVFMLRVFGELSFRQIGALFGKTENWACVTFYRAKQKIMNEMEESK